MFTDKTLTAAPEDEAVEKVQGIFPNSYVHCFGESSNGFETVKMILMQMPMKETTTELKLATR